MPEGQTKPKQIPEVIRKHIIYEVALDDDRFSSKRLAHIAHAKKTLKDLLT